jgi:hypothetical protein
MKLSDIIERRKVKTREGEPEQFKAALKGSHDPPHSMRGLAGRPHADL